MDDTMILQGVTLECLSGAALLPRLHWNEAGIGHIEHPLTFWLQPIDEDTHA